MAVSVPPHYLPTLLSPPLLKHADYTKLQKIPGKSRYFSRQISDTWGAGTGKLRLRHSGLSVNAGSKGEERGALGGEVIKAAALLSLIPLVWGTYTPVIRFVYQIDSPPPSSLLNLAFYVVSVSSLILTSILQNRGPLPSKSSLKAGLDLGTWLFLGSTMQLLGLKFTTGTQAGVLVQLTTVIVPVLESIVLRKSVAKRLWIGIIIALCGVLLLTLDQAANGVSGSVSLASMVKGDSLVLLAALFYSVHVVRLDKYAKENDPLALAASKQIVQLGYSSAYALLPAIISESRKVEYGSFLHSISSEQGISDLRVIAAVVLWNGIVASALTSWAQSYGQQKVSPSVASLLFTTQPLWSATFCSIFLSETIGQEGIVGIGLVVSALGYSIPGLIISTKNDHSISSSDPDSVVDSNSNSN